MKNNKGFSIKNLILTILFIAIIVCLLIWIISMREEIRDDKKLIESATNSSEVEKTNTSKNTEFSDNIEVMRKAAEKYFTEETLPAEVGDSVKISLNDMISKELLTSSDIKNSSKYDLDGSYVQVTKTSNEYVMKVYLKSDSKSDYSIYYYGFYDYCANNSLCEKDETKTSSSSGVKDTKSSATNLSNSSSNSSSSASNSNSSSRNYSNSGSSSNRSYSNSSSRSSAASSKSNNTASASTSASTKSNKKVTTTTTTKKSGVKKTTLVTTIKRYFRKVTSSSSKTHSETTEETHSESHREESKEESKTPTPTPTPTPIESKETCTTNTIYEYLKTTNGTTSYTNWSDWNKAFPNRVANRQIQKKTTRKHVQNKITTKSDLSKPIYGTENVVVGTKNTRICTRYRKTTTTTNYYTTHYGNASRTYVGTIAVTSAPTSSNAVRYERVGSYNWYCANTCTSGTVYLYKAYQLNPSYSMSSSSSSSNSSYSCAAYTTYTEAYNATRTFLKGYEKSRTVTPIYQYNVYYRYRDLTSTNGSRDTKWSTYNDTSLLNNGYKYTGNTRSNKVCK